jgi:hypothetical protein
VSETSEFRTCPVCRDQFIVRGRNKQQEYCSNRCKGKVATRRGVVNRRLAWHKKDGLE